MKKESFDNIPLMDTPEGLELKSRFFIRDKDHSETTIEMYIFLCVEDATELPTGAVIEKGYIVTARSHVSTKYNQFDWSTSKESFWNWFNRVFIDWHDDYETVSGYSIIRTLETKIKLNK